jgi:hypothetical protein
MAINRCRPKKRNACACHVDWHTKISRGQMSDLLRTDLTGGIRHKEYDRRYNQS